MASRLVVVRVFDNEIEAQTARSLLESEGLTASVWKDDAGGAYPALQATRGVRLVVPEEEVETARSLLAPQ